MGWLISIAFLVAGCILKDQMMLVTSGLFAIAGSISYVGNKIKKD